MPTTPEKAKERLNQAKADGYDGSLDYVVLSEPKDHAIGLAVQSLLQAVGFEVNLILANNAGDIVQNVYVKHDFDLAHAGIGMYESISRSRIVLHDQQHLDGEYCWICEPGDGSADRRSTTSQG